LILVIVAAAALIVRWRQPHLDIMLETDEADYVRASSYGAWANYIGARERSGAAFAGEVFKEYRRTGSSHAYAREWEADDASALRHYHPPLAFYPVGVLAGSGIRDERTMRAAPLVTGVLACLASALLAYVLLAGTAPSLRLLFSATAGMVTAASAYHALGSTTITPHAAFSLLSTITLLALTRAVQTSAARWWIAASALLGVTLLTVPYWTLLIVAALWVWMWGLREGRRSIRLLVYACISVAIAITIGWPPAILGLGMVKPVLLYLSIALHPPDVGRATGDWIPAFFLVHPLLTVLLLVGIVSLWVATPEQRRSAVPTLLFALGFFLLNLRVSYMKPLYVSDVIPATAALAAALSGWAAMKLPSRVSAIPGVVALTAAAVSVILVPAPQAASSGWRQTLSTLDTRFAGQHVLVTPRPAGAMVKYYLTRANIVLDSDDPGEVGALRAKLAAGGIDAVLGWGGAVDRNGAAVDATRGKAPDGQATVESSTISWWLTK
jgi:hypothetical protein